MPAPTGTSLLVPGTPAGGAGNGFKKWFEDLWSQLTTLGSRGTFVPYTATVAVGGGGSLGTGAVVDTQYAVLGDDTVVVDFDITLGTSPNIAGDVTITLPAGFTPAHGYVTGHGIARPVYNGTAHPITPALLSTTPTNPVSLRFHTGTPAALTAFTTTTPGTWAANGRMVGTLAFRV
ncbi:hypothetical protein [Cellulomonas palmilytica]|uniref:hypothetical protein n=1 Tax=Cellulomonas palmilytica TaxID=2608402 RepID=UPI001F27D872|nr:hypothetical protein [Cellulomonas palmilytica]UJP39321.1 hypothetical protein F1D97_13375 [Cellulomonas palmilytica]